MVNLSSKKEKIMYKLKSKDLINISGGYACLHVKHTAENIDRVLNEVYGIC